MRFNEPTDIELRLHIVGHGVADATPRILEEQVEEIAEGKILPDFARLCNDHVSD